jgi:hypothetical protein
MRVVSGVSSGKWVWMMSKSSSLATLLNMLVRSMNNAASVGSWLLVCGMMNAKQSFRLLVVVCDITL